MSAQYDMFIEQGADFLLSMVLADDGVPVDLTNYTAKMQIKEDFGLTSLFELSTTNGRIAINGPLGQITLIVSGAVSTPLTWTEGIYDLELTSPGGSVMRLLRGRVYLSREVTV